MVITGRPVLVRGQMAAVRQPGSNLMECLATVSCTRVNSTDHYYVYKFGVILQQLLADRAISTNLVIENTGAFVNAGDNSYNNVLVKSGGTSECYDFITINGNILEIESNGTVCLNYANNGTTPAQSIFKGNEKFNPGSFFIVKRRPDATGILFDASVTFRLSQLPSKTCYFGNLYFDLTTSTAWSAVLNSLTADLTANDLEISGTIYTNTLTLLDNSSSANVVINGNLMINPMGTGGTIRLSNSTGTVTATVKGNFTQTGNSQFYVASAKGTNTLNINGDLTVTGINAKFSMYDATNNNAFTTVNLSGNLTVANGGLVE